MKNVITERIDSYLEKRRKAKEEEFRKLRYERGSSFSSLVGMTVGVAGLKLFLPEMFSTNLPLAFIILFGMPMAFTSVGFAIWRYLIWKDKN